ncbi:protein-tyrosine-phosphatase [Streptomyces albus]|uniref:arsenate reductase/protein-tyrosine-phosphatase family protein n=1 Tax=Streptomyces albus TaxID=1888 RepID=UPI0004C9ECBA|nr:protein-tyrosine-phosphatase [Streptomyces albus]
MTGPGTARPRRILAVCLGNHCRSPLAAAVLARLGGSAVEARSAGIRDKWAGRPAHPAMIAAAAARGYDLTGHRGVHLSPDMLDWADVVLAMDHANHASLHQLADLRAFRKVALYLGNRDVPDPFGQDEAAFAACAGIIEAGAARHLP